MSDGGSSRSLWRRDSWESAAIRVTGAAGRGSAKVSRPSQSPGAGPEDEAGAAEWKRILGEALRRFHLLSYAAASVLLLSLLVRAILGPRPRRFAVRFAIAFVMSATAMYSGLVLSPRVVRMQHETGTAPSSLPETDPRRIAFERLHSTSTGVQLVPLAGGLLLLFWELKD